MQYMRILRAVKLSSDSVSSGGIRYLLEIKKPQHFLPNFAGNFRARIGLRYSFIFSCRDI